MLSIARFRLVLGVLAKVCFKVIYFLVLILFTPVHLLCHSLRLFGIRQSLYVLIEIYGYRTKQIKKHVTKHIVFTG